MNVNTAHHRTIGPSSNATEANCSSSAGFTLIELVIVMFLAGILTTLAIPAYRNLILNQHVKTAASALETAMLFARSEAIKRADNISIIPNGSDWKNGWTVQLADATMIRSSPALNPALSAIPGTTVTYQLNGHAAAAVAPLVFRVDGNPDVTARCVVLDLSGRPSLIMDTDRNPANGCN